MTVESGPPKAVHLSRHKWTTLMYTPPGLALIFEKASHGAIRRLTCMFSSSLLLSSLESSDTQVSESGIRALLGTTSHFCEALVLKSRTAPKCTALTLKSASWSVAPADEGQHAGQGER